MMHIHRGRVQGRTYKFTLVKCRCNKVRTYVNPVTGYSPRPKAWPHPATGWIDEKALEQANAEAEQIWKTISKRPRPSA